ncbi:hypothetical protein GIB67_019007 [Kingdonia uniflora]|uniref:FHA domain-containing protein n=1 Tax=Kingdonia uniflora TaxID=39325 RepID=A0A7J7MZX3_9MAGN|nr:hypothetical protein GIB67_019007 [Kingdonia uniflora]
MALEENQEGTPLSTKPTPSPKSDAQLVVSQTNSCENGISPAKRALTAKESIIAVARKISTQQLQNSGPGVWGVLTAISANARKRHQGMNILLTSDEHCIGRLVEDIRFRIESNAVSGSHCKIYRKTITAEDVEQGSSVCTSVFLKDTSTNGTYLNWEKLKKNSSGSKLQHGDIVSFAAVPQHEVAFAFVFRDDLSSTSLVEGANLKRKAEEFVSENKRIRGIGIGAPEGPISLDDVRSLQRSNMELRKQLESHIHTIETMSNENRTTAARHENEMKELKESVTQSSSDEIKELQHKLDVKQKELGELITVSSVQQQAMADLNERLSASMRSRADADEIVNSQKAIVSELERQLDEERNLRREEREKSLADQRAALQRAHSEAQEELKRQTDASSRQERELNEVINKLQESEKESRLLVETLRSKLEDTRERLVISEKKVRQLEARVQEEQQISANTRKKVEALEHEMIRVRKELEGEKVAREEAWAKVSALELEIAAALRDLSMEKQRFHGARERIILRETQLRAFYSTTEEISSLFSKQQEQLKAMRRTLEDEDNYENMPIMSMDFPTPTKGDEAILEEKLVDHQKKSFKEASGTSSPKVDRVQVESTSDEVSVTEKHDCEVRSQEDGNNTQDADCTSAAPCVRGGAFGSDIEGVGTAPVLEGDLIEPERVVGTESPNIDLNKPSTVGEDTMQLDDEVQTHENNPTAMEDTEAAITIRTADLMTSEVAGSWAINTAPSVHGENESPRSDYEADQGAAHLVCSDAQAAGSQIGSTKLSQERRALSEMIRIVAPDMKERFGAVEVSDSDTEDVSENQDGDDVNGVNTRGEAISDDAEDENAVDDTVDETDDDDDGEEDSLG